jgi:hypothetical protein
MRDFCPDNSSFGWTLEAQSSRGIKRTSKTPIVNSDRDRDDQIVSLSEQIRATLRRANGFTPAQPAGR